MFSRIGIKGSWWSNRRRAIIWSLSILISGATILLVGVQIGDGSELGTPSRSENHEGGDLVSAAELIRLIESGRITKLRLDVDTGRATGVTTQGMTLVAGNGSYDKLLLAIGQSPKLVDVWFGGVVGLITHKPVHPLSAVLQIGGLLLILLAGSSGVLQLVRHLRRSYPLGWSEAKAL